MSVEVMRSVIEAAEGRVPVDTLFANAQIVDVYGQRVAPGSVAVKDGVIVGVLYDGRDDAAGTYEAAEVIDCQGRYLAPGFIDGHLHIESSNIRPAEYARMAATRGTTTAIADSHEIANVSGLDGLRFMVEDGRRAPISIKYMMPSCVPALPDEQAGAVITAVSTTPGAIGYASLSSVEDSVKALKVEGVECTEATVLDGTYAIQRPFVFATKTDGTLSEAAQAFFDFAMDPANAELYVAAGVVPANS